MRHRTFSLSEPWFDLSLSYCRERIATFRRVKFGRGKKKFARSQNDRCISLAMLKLGTFMWADSSPLSPVPGKCAKLGGNPEKPIYFVLVSESVGRLPLYIEGCYPSSYHTRSLTLWRCWADKFSFGGIGSCQVCENILCSNQEQSPKFLVVWQWWFYSFWSSNSLIKLRVCKNPP